MQEISVLQYEVGLVRLVSELQCKVDALSTLDSDNNTEEGAVNIVGDVVDHQQCEEPEFSELEPVVRLVSELQYKVDAPSTLDSDNNTEEGAVNIVGDVVDHQQCEEPDFSELEPVFSN